MSFFSDFTSSQSFMLALHTPTTSAVGV